MKVVQNALFRSCAARFGLIAFVSVKVVKIVTLAWKARQNAKRVRFLWILYKTLVSTHAQEVLPKSCFSGLNFLKSLDLSQILLKTGKQCAFHENCRSYAYRSYAARFGQIAFVSVKVVKIVTLAWKARQNGKKMRFLWKLYKTLVSGHAQVTLSKTVKEWAFYENCTKHSFQVIRSTFWPNRIFERQSCQNRHTGLELSSKRENSALSIKIVQNALFRSCAARFGQIAFLSVKVAKIVTLASNSLQNVERVRFSWKLYKTLVSGHTQHVLAKLHLWASKLSKSSHWPEKLVKTGKECAFYKNCTRPSFQVMRSTFWRNRILKRQSCQIRHTGLKFSPKRGNSAHFMKIVQNARFRSCAARFGQIAFLSVKVVKIVTLASNSLQNGERVRF